MENELIKRGRNSCLIVLTENDILINGDELQHVASGEVLIFADGTVDVTNGELIPVSQEAVSHAIASGNQIFNLEDV